VESEFFGHAQGAFTGADRPKVGKFTAVGSGTLFLDEIDTLTLEQQMALLRVIETGEFEPVGSNETQYSTARLIVASNLSLEEEVQQRRFRQDLYYRLNVMSFHLPPLRLRPQDIAPLVRSMVARFSRKFHKELFDIRPELLAALESFTWPGNIRQLENAVQHAVLVSAGRELSLEHLPPLTSRGRTSTNILVSATPDSLQHSRELLEHDLIQRALMSSAYNLSRAADALGISRVTLHKKMKKYTVLGPEDVLTIVPTAPSKARATSPPHRAQAASTPSPCTPRRGPMPPVKTSRCRCSGVETRALARDSRARPYPQRCPGTGALDRRVRSWQGRLDPWGVRGLHSESLDRLSGS
jgi:DNA-binding NtrC family response regulator